jgi:hypothetical protein
VPVTKFNLARSWEQANETLKAIDAWQGWLAMSPAAPERPEVERTVGQLGEKLAKLGVQAVTISTMPVAAMVSVDGVRIGLAPVTVELPPTRHLVRAELEGRDPQEKSLEVALAHPMIERFELAPAGQASRPEPLPLPMQPVPLPLPRPLAPRPTDPEFALSLSDDAVQVHLEADSSEVRLYRTNGNPNGECRTPCDAPIMRASETFFIGGSGVTGSSTFVLADHRRAGKASLKVKAGNAGVFFGLGTILASLGLTGIITGLIFAAGHDPAAGIGLLIGGVLSSVGAGFSYGLNTTTVTFAD